MRAIALQWKEMNAFGINDGDFSHRSFCLQGAILIIYFPAKLCYNCSTFFIRLIEYKNAINAFSCEIPIMN
nr:hypothetical protein [Tanacetum cinerariifolium]